MKRRTSSRHFTEEPVTEEELAKILKAGMYAPVGSNRYHDLYVTVIQDREILQALSEDRISVTVIGGTE